MAKIKTRPFSKGYFFHSYGVNWKEGHLQFSSGRKHMGPIYKLLFESHYWIQGPSATPPWPKTFKSFIFISFVTIKIMYSYNLSRRLSLYYFKKNYLIWFSVSFLLFYYSFILHARYINPWPELLLLMDKHYNSWEEEIFLLVGVLKETVVYTYVKYRVQWKRIRPLHLNCCGKRYLKASYRVYTILCHLFFK